jgi:hypothetical protein
MVLLVNWLILRLELKMLSRGMWSVRDGVRGLLKRLRIGQPALALVGEHPVKIGVTVYYVFRNQYPVTVFVVHQEQYLIQI